MTRKVVVFNMGDNSRTSIMTDAKTWGEVLSASSQIRSMVGSDMKVVIRETKNVIETENAVLPDGDIMIYLTPGKVKSGAYNFKTGMRPRVTEITKQIIDAIIIDCKNAVAKKHNNQKAS